MITEEEVLQAPKVREEPSAQDRLLADRLLRCLDPGAPDAANREVIAYILGTCRRDRDAELKRIGKDLSNQTIRTRAAARDLQRVYLREQKRHHQKIADCDLLKQMLLDRGVTQDEVNTALRATRPPRG